MVHSCYICKISSEKDPSISFHRFPKNDQQRNKWIKSLGLEGSKISASSKLCSKHFPDDSFRIREGGRRDLKPSAIPSNRSVFRKNYSDDSIVPQEMLSAVQNNGLSKEETESFTMFLADNFELFPDHILKSNYLEGSELLLNESMETELVGAANIKIRMDDILEPVFGENLSDLESSFDLSPSVSSVSSPMSNGKDSASTRVAVSEEIGSLLDVDSLMTKISADNNFKWRAYFKQCTVEDFSTPEMAKRNIELGKREIETHQKKIKILQQQNRRLKCRVSRLKQLLKQCKQMGNVDIGSALEEEDEIDI